MIGWIAPDAARSVNMTAMFDEQARHISYVIAEVQKRGATTVEPEAEAQQAWCDLIASMQVMGMTFFETCTPGYYNNEGKGWGEDAPLFVGHPGGALAYFAHIDAWRKSGQFEGLAFG